MLMDEVRTNIEETSDPVPIESLTEPEDDSNVEIINDETSDIVVAGSNSDLEETPLKKRKVEKVEESNDDGRTCMICLDDWTSSGSHRVCCLTCGHVFGRQCIVKWIGQKKKCPQCNKGCNVNSIRNLYVSKLVACDNEKEELQSEVNSLKFEKRKLEEKLENAQKEIIQLKIKLEQCGSNNLSQSQESQSICQIKFHLEKTISLSDGTCRVLTYNEATQTILISQKSSVSLFPGYGCKKISHIGTTYNPNLFIYLHQNMIRDICFNPNDDQVLLSVGFDNCAKVYSFQSNSVVKTYKTTSPLWCCCWDECVPNIFFTGSGNGIVTQYDVTQDESLSTYAPPGEREVGPVISLRGAPYAPAGRALSRGGFICCRLNCVYVYERTSQLNFTVHTLSSLTGPFISMSYDHVTQHILTSSRPTSTCSLTRHVLSQLVQDTDGVVTSRLVHTFYGGPRQNLLARSCFLRCGGRLLIVAGQESSNSVEIWDTTSLSKIQSIPVPDAVLDVISIKVRNRILLGALTEKHVRFYEAP